MIENDAPGAASVAAHLPDRFQDIEQQIRSTQVSLGAFNQELRVSSQLGSQFGRAIGNAFAGLAVQGKSLNQVLSTLALSLSKMVFSAAFKPLEQAVGGAFGSLISAPALFSAQGKVAAPAAFSISAGGSFAAPDPFAAMTSPGGMSNGSTQLGGNSTPSVVFNIQTPDAESFRRSETQIAAMLARAVTQGQRNL